MSEKVEQLVGRTEPPFEQLVREQYKSRCGNCGGLHKLKVKLVVPPEAGGLRVASNAILICRACEMATDASACLPGTEGARRIINFWVSRQLHQRMTDGMRSSRGLKSMSALVRYLMSMYVSDVERFDDLAQYQDATVGDVKLNVWVPTEQYETFKTLANNRGLNVTDTVKALILLFDNEIVERDPPTVSEEK